MARQNPLWFIRAKRWFRRWMGVVASDCLDPLRDRSALLQLLSFPFVVYFVFLAGGFRAVSGEISQSWMVLQAILYAIPLFVVWNMVSACFKVSKEERREGKWFDIFFVYNEPTLVHITKVTDADNDRLQTIKIKEAEAGGYVYLNVEFDGFERHRIKAQVLPIQIPAPMPWNTVQGGPINCAVYILKDKTALLATQCETQNWSIVKVYMTAFSIR